MTHPTPASAVSILRDALKGIADYRKDQNYEITAVSMRKIARDALAHNDSKSDVWSHSETNMRAYGQACILADRAARQSAEPMRTIRTWQERTGNHNIRHGSAKHMIAEIADLRAHIAQLERELKAARAVSDEHFQTIIAERAAIQPQGEVAPIGGKLAYLRNAIAQGEPPKLAFLTKDENTAYRDGYYACRHSAMSIYEKLVVAPAQQEAKAEGRTYCRVCDMDVLRHCGAKECGLITPAAPASVASAEERDQKQLADWLLLHPVDGSKLTFAGPPEAFGPGLSQVKMMADDGSEWTLIGGLREGYKTEAERNATLLRVIKEEQAAPIADEAPAQTNSYSNISNNCAPTAPACTYPHCLDSAEPTAPASIGDDAEFMDTLERYNIATCKTNDLVACIDRYIDARSTAAQAVKAEVVSAKSPEPVDGDLLPPVGSKVLIHLARECDWVEHTVTGYYVWGDLGGSPSLHRVFVRVVSADGYPNARMLRDVQVAQRAEKGGAS